MSKKNLKDYKALVRRLAKKVFAIEKFIDEVTPNQAANESFRVIQELDLQYFSNLIGTLRRESDRDNYRFEFVTYDDFAFLFQPEPNLVVDLFNVRHVLAGLSSQLRDNLDAFVRAFKVATQLGYEEGLLNCLNTLVVRLFAVTNILHLINVTINCEDLTNPIIVRPENTGVIEVSPFVAFPLVLVIGRHLVNGFLIAYKMAIRSIRNSAPWDVSKMDLLFSIDHPAWDLLSALTLELERTPFYGYYTYS